MAAVEAFKQISGPDEAAESASRLQNETDRRISAEGQVKSRVVKDQECEELSHEMERRIAAEASARALEGQLAALRALLQPKPVDAGG